MSGKVAKMDRVLKLKETESIAVPAMTDYLSVGNNTADNANSHTYVYEPNKSLHQVSLRNGVVGSANLGAILGYIFHGTSHPNTSIYAYNAYI